VKPLSCLALVAAVGSAAVACGGDDGGPTFADDHPRIYLPNDRDRLTALVTANAETWARFKRIVDLQLDGANIYGFQAWYAALVGQLTGEPRYCEAAVAQIDDFVSAEEDKISSGERPDAAFDSYLEVGFLVGDLALTYDWCFEQTSNGQRERWITYANQAVWNVWHHEEATWGGEAFPWSGWSVDNPSNNYYYSFLRATMLLGIATRGETPEGEQWIAKFRDEKIAGQLVPTFNRDLTGGGSREGTGYGVAMKNLFELYDFWHGSTGEELDELTGHTRDSMLHMMHSTAPTLDRVAPIGDHSRDASAAWFDYHRHYLQTLAYLYADDPVAARATTMLADSSVPEMDQPFMYVYDFLYTPDVTPAPLASLGRSYYASGVGQLYTRSSWAADATWLTFIAGAYTESHAHQDQGSFLLYKGDWLAYDANIDSNDGLRQDGEPHNLIRFFEGGSAVAQREGTTSEMAAIARGAGWVYAAGDLTAAYGASSPIDRWQRELVMLEPDVVVIYDRVTAPGVEQRWQVVGPSAFTVSGGSATSTSGGQTLRVAAAPAGHRHRQRRRIVGGLLGGLPLRGALDRHHRAPPRRVDRRRGHRHPPADAGAQDGVTITLADGRTATVRFNRDAIGGHLTVSGGGRQRRSRPGRRDRRPARARVIDLARPGAVLADRFILGERLGAGGMGAVFRARDRDGREVAIKTALPDLDDGGEAARRLAREANALQLLDHPHIVGAIELVPVAGRLYLVVELVDGRPLGALIGPARWRRGARWCWSASSSTPSSTPTPRRRPPRPQARQPAGRGGRPAHDPYDHVKVLDFGLVKLLDAAAAIVGGERLTRTGIAFGTPAYMAPEAALGRAIDRRVDLYAVGVILFELLTGALPFVASDALGYLRAARRAAAAAPGRRGRRRAVVHAGPRGAGRRRAGQGAGRAVRVGDRHARVPRRRVPVAAVAGDHGARSSQARSRSDCGDTPCLRSNSRSLSRAPRRSPRSSFSASLRQSRAALSSRSRGASNRTGSSSSSPGRGAALGVGAAPSLSQRRPRPIKPISNTAPTPRPIQVVPRDGAAGGACGSETGRAGHRQGRARLAGQPRVGQAARQHRRRRAAPPDRSPAPASAPRPAVPAAPPAPRRAAAARSGRSPRPAWRRAARWRRSPARPASRPGSTRRCAATSSPSPAPRARRRPACRGTARSTSRWSRAGGRRRSRPASSCRRRGAPRWPA
jgi:serine/threonine protein kinase